MLSEGTVLTGSWRNTTPPWELRAAPALTELLEAIESTPGGGHVWRRAQQAPTKDRRHCPDNTAVCGSWGSPAERKRRKLAVADLRAGLITVEDAACRVYGYEEA